MVSLTFFGPAEGPLLVFIFILPEHKATLDGVQGLQHQIVLRSGEGLQTNRRTGLEQLRKSGWGKVKAGMNCVSKLVVSYVTQR